MEKLELGSPETQSADIVAESIERLKELFPEAFNEGKADFDVLRELLGDAVETGEEKYGLNWHGKWKARRLALTPSTGTLRPAPEESVDWDTTQNLMIEGDNLEVLKLLQKSYAGKLKLIYIDPPYNTGNDFVYPDDFKDNIRNYLELTGQVDGEGRKVSSNPESSGRFHTAWLNMMYPRIRLARSLLRTDGFIFITIDDGEVGNLRHLCDEVFGSENFIANVVWQKKYTRANDATFFSTNHDHILVYAKNAAATELGRVPRGEKQLEAYSNPDDHPKGPWKATPLHARSGSNTDAYTFQSGFTWAPPKGTYRRYSDESMRTMEESDEIWFGKDGSQVPQRKSFLSEVSDGMVPVTIWDHKFAGHNHEASTELKDLGLGGAFTSPKPTRLIQRILQLTTMPFERHIAMDFFAGSGTTADAVMRTNAEDGGNRRFVLVQLPELLDAENKGHRIAAQYCEDLGRPGYLSELTKERLRRAAIRIDKEAPGVEGDRGFRVFKLDSSNIRAWEPSPDELEATLFDSVDHIKDDRSEEDIRFELLLKLGLDLTVPMEDRTIAGKKVHSVGGGVLFVCLAEGIGEEVAEALATGIVGWRDELDPAGDTTCVFRDSGFENDVAKTNLAAILEQHGIETVRSL